MSDDLQIPPVPPECDLRDFKDFPLDFNRLFQSETWTLGTHEERVAAFELWCRSFHQVPAGSLPNKNEMLAKYSGAHRRWAKLREHALRGWVEHSDGRLYHPVVTEKVLHCWKRKCEQRAQTFGARVGKIRKAIAACGDPVEKLALEDQLQALLHDAPTHVTGSKRREVKEREGIETPSAGGGRTVETWNAYALAYQQRWGVPPTRNAKVNGQLAQFLLRVPVEEAPDIAAFFVKSNKGLYVSAKHPVNLLLRDAEGLRTEYLTGRQGTEAEARRGDRTAARGSVFSKLIGEAEARESDPERKPA